MFFRVKENKLINPLIVIKSFAIINFFCNPLMFTAF